MRSDRCERQTVANDAGESGPRLFHSRWGSTTAGGVCVSEADQIDAAGEITERRSGPVRLERLYRDQSARLRAFAGAIVRDPQAADDVVQNVFARLCDRDLPDGPLDGWLLQVVRNEALTLLRKRKVDADARRKIATPTAAAKQQHDSENDEQLDELRRRFDRLSPDDRSLLTGRIVEGLSYNELSKKLNTPVSTLTTRVSRLIKCLRDN